MADARRPTIRDVAATAGVSIQTVSRVTNGRPDVAPETISRVLEAIRQLGYTPNMLARGLTVGRSQVLGVVAYGLEYFGPSRTVSAIERRAAQLGYGISLTLILKPETDDVGAILDALRARQVDGIIWAVPEVADNMAWSRTRGPQLPVPAMLVGMAGSSYLPSIGIDNTAIGRVATNHLLAGGVRNIGIITGPLNWREARHRLAGWRGAMDATGRAVDEGLIVEGDWTVESGEAAMYRLFAACPTIDAVFASNDSMALGALHAAHSIGRVVPDELSIVGVDNIAEASHFWPRLTTVDQPITQEGSLAVDAIARLIDAERRSHRPDAEPEFTLLQPRLIVRDSARRPAQVPASTETADPTTGANDPLEFAAAGQHRQAPGTTPRN